MVLADGRIGSAVPASDASKTFDSAPGSVIDKSRAPAVLRVRTSPVIREDSPATSGIPFAGIVRY